jgi:hypothetical protein
MGELSGNQGFALLLARRDSTHAHCLLLWSHMRLESRDTRSCCHGRGVRHTGPRGWLPGVPDRLQPYIPEDRVDEHERGSGKPREARLLSGRRSSSSRRRYSIARHEVATTLRTVLMHACTSRAVNTAELIGGARD